MWERDVLDFTEGDEDLQQHGDDDPPDEGHPPTLTVEELEEVDRLAGYEEISRLIKCKFYVNQAQKNARKVSLCRPGQCMTGDIEVVNGTGDVVL